MAEISFLDFLLIIFLVLLNGFFVASEFAFVKIRMTKINELIVKGSRRARRAKEVVTDLDRSLSSTQLGITLASIALGFVGEAFFEVFFEIVFEDIFYVVDLLFGIELHIRPDLLALISFVTGYFVITFMHVVIGELAPKSISIQFAEKTALWCAEPLYWFMWITNPILNFFVWTSNGLLRLLKIPPATETHHQVFSEEELKIIIEDSIMKGEIEPYESKLIFNILDFTDSTVKSILTPRIDIEALPIECQPNDILKVSIESGYSRIPIYEDTLDNIVGFVHIKDVIAYANGMNSKEEFEIKTILRPTIVVPEGKPLDDLLKEMQSLQTQVSVIIDEYGSVEGIVTIEDILEAIVGPIDDEFDSHDSSVAIEINENKMIVGGLVSLESFNSALNSEFNLSIVSEKSATVAGYVLELFESEIPQMGMSTDDGNLDFKITKQSGNRIEEVEVTPLESETDPTETEDKE